MLEPRPWSMMKRRLEAVSFAGINSLWSMAARWLVRRKNELLRRRSRLRRFEPGTAEPVGDESDLLVGQYLATPKGRHPIVMLSIKIFVSRIVDETDEPPA